MRLHLRHRPTYRLYQETKTKVTSIVIAVAFLASVGSAALPFVISGNALAASNVVTPVALDGWVASSASGGQVNFVTDGSAPLGSGALKLTTDNTNPSVARLTHDFDMPLSSVSTLSYKTKQIAAADTKNGNITMRVNVDTDGNGTMDDQLMFEPYYNGFNGNSMTGWQTWNVATGKLWSNYELHYNGLGGVGAGSYASNFTIADVLHDFPDAKLTGLVVSMGTWNVSQQVLADNVVLNGDTYDFEPVVVTPCTTTNSVVTNDLSTWNLSETRATGHNAIVADGLHVWTEGATSTDKAAGYYPASFNLADLGEGFGLDATATTGTIPPALQLTVDLDGNGTPEGNLVAEPGFYGADTLWLSSNWTGIDLSSAPTTINGGGTGKGGTVNAWLAAFPNAKVVAVGYSLGSGVHGDYVITKITAGCASYTFAPDTTPPAVPTNLSWLDSNDNPPVNSFTSVQKGVLSWQDSDSGVDHYVYKFWTNIPGYFEGAANAWTTDSSTYITKTSTGGSIWTDFYDKEGTYYFCVEAVDAAGNTSDCSDTYAVTYDKTAPSVPVITAPVNGQHFASTPILNKWDASTDSLSGIDHYQVAYLYDDGHSFGGSTCAGTQIDSQTLSGCRDTNGTSRDHVPALTEQGGVTIWVRAYDKAGNVSNWSAPVHYYYDATAPGVPSALLFDNNNNGVADNGYITTQNFHFNLSSSSDVTRYQLKYWNDIPGSPFNGQTNAWSPTDITAAGHMNVLGVYTDLFTQGEGVHHFAFSACDAAGNCSAFSTPFTVTYDATKPTVSVLAPASGSIKRSPVTVKVNATDNLALKQIMVNVYRGTTVVKSCSTSVITPLNVSSYTLTCNPAVLARGAYTIKATATDMAGNVSDITTSTFTVRRPIIAATVTSNNSNTIQVTNTNNQTANTGNAGNNGNTNSGNAQTGDASNNNQGVLGATTTNDETSGPETVNFANASAEKSGKAFGIGWWWILVLVGLGGFFLLLAARRRRKDKQENA